MLSRAEFQVLLQSSDHLLKELNKKGATYSIGFLAPILFVSVLADRADPGLNAIKVFGLVLLFAMLVFLCFWFAEAERKIAGSAGLICPHCSRKLIRKRGKVVLSTGQCDHCGEHIIQDAKPITMENPL